MSNFTFITAVDGPTLSEASAKRIRGHVTRANFAKRRETRGLNTTLEQRATRKIICTTERRDSSGSPDAVLPLLPTTPTQASSAQPALKNFICQYLPMIWSQLFLDGSKYPLNEEEAAWASLLASDHALAESSLAIGARHLLPAESYEDLYSDLSSRVTKTIISRLNSDQALSDAVLATVMTMAFGECLVHNRRAWAVHIEGGVQLIRERIARGLPAMAPWVRDLLVMDTVNDVFGFPRFYHKNIIKVLRTTNDAQYQPLIRIAALCEDLVGLRVSISEARKSSWDSDSLFRLIVEPIGALLVAARALREDKNESVRAASIAIELVIYLSWSPAAAWMNLTAITEELKEAMRRVLGRPCAYMDLTSCQLILGAVAAEEGSSTRTWFTDKLQSASRSLSSRGWDGALNILEGGFPAEDELAAEFRTIWRQIGIYKQTVPK
ncbi:hypothetical protein F5Y16DRAFT_388339 [Xylariaceae sp. FL0255]|nr:hypothetical protein F5Y16DRAFT_388339 [Xylariaceae sp. FL0255]